MKIFCDIDNTILKSDKRIVELINKKFNLKRTESDIRDWGYKSICRAITKLEVEELYASDEFFDGVEMFDGVIEALRGNSVTFCTAGTYDNLLKKMKYIKDNIPFDTDFQGFTCYKKESLSETDMSGGVQIDDRFDCLVGTNAKIKILFKNGNDYDWQKTDGVTEVYIANTWKEIKDIIDFAKEMDDFEHYDYWLRDS